MCLATTKGRLQLDDRLRPSCSTQPTHDVNEQLGQALGQISLREELLGIPIINGPSSSEDFAQVGSEDRGVELALANVGVRCDNLSPRCECGHGVCPSCATALASSPVVGLLPVSHLCAMSAPAALRS